MSWLTLRDHHNVRYLMGAAPVSVTNVTSAHTDTASVSDTYYSFPVALLFYWATEDGTVVVLIKHVLLESMQDVPGGQTDL